MVEVKIPLVVQGWGEHFTLRAKADIKKSKVILIKN
jgi:hypothetical protein